jgi:hypothetical protein
LTETPNIVATTLEREIKLVGSRQATPAIRDRAVIEAKSAVVKVSARVIRSLTRGVADLGGKIEEAEAAHPDFLSLSRCRERLTQISVLN